MTTTTTGLIAWRGEVLHYSITETGHFGARTWIDGELQPVPVDHNLKAAIRTDAAK